MTFDYYGIREGDSIIALPERDAARPSEANLWVNLTRDRENLNECMRWMLDPSTSGEAARLRDLHMMKMEHRPRAFSKMCGAFLQSKGQGRTMIETKLSSERPKLPSTDALPTSWSLDEPEMALTGAQNKKPYGG
jgi:hypothetical protein